MLQYVLSIFLTQLKIIHTWVCLSVIKIINKFKDKILRNKFDIGVRQDLVNILGCLLRIFRKEGSLRSQSGNKHYIIKILILIFYKLYHLVINFQVFDMDYEDIIKLEEQSPVYSTGNNSHNMKQCMALFYDNDSEHEKRQLRDQVHTSYYISFEQAINYVQNYVDIIDTPLDDILLCFEGLQYAQDLDKNILRKKILKRKNLLKRYRAKNRLPKVIYPYQHFNEQSVTNILETEAEIKKKRNRVSAQISRDRKKQYFKELEIKNLKLEQEIIRTRLENEKLKKQMEATDFKPKAKIYSETFNNKLTKLLLFLGILCLISILKQTFASTTQSLSKIKTTLKPSQISQFCQFQHTKVFEQGQQKVVEFLQDSQVEQQLLSNEQEKNAFVSQGIVLERNRQKRNFFQGLIEKLTQMKTGIEKNFN